MFARAWEDGIITYDEHQLITEVVEFLGMHPDRIKRLSEEARESIEISPPEDIYLEMLSQALVDNQLVSDEVALLETFRGAYGITEEVTCKIAKFGNTRASLFRKCQNLPRIFRNSII